MDKVLKLEEAIKTSKKLRDQGKVLVLAGGCFDVLHRGHLAYLEGAKQQGDTLFVALEGDENVGKLKGPGRPVNTQRKRAENLAALESVDYITLLPTLTSDSDYFSLTKKLSLDVIAITEGDPNQTEKEKQANIVGGKVIVVTKRLAHFSTTEFLKHI